MVLTWIIKHIIAIAIVYIIIVIIAIVVVAIRCVIVVIVVDDVVNRSIQITSTNRTLLFNKN